MALTRDDLEKNFRDLEIPLYNFVLRWVFQGALAEEIVQEAFMIAWRKRTDVEVATIKGLLYKTSQNLALNEIRKRSMRERFKNLVWWHEPSGPPGALSQLMEEEELGKMKKELELLPFEYREALLLTEFSDMTHAEIGKSLGIAPGTVGSRKNRALEILREKIGEKNELKNEF